jgi:hypothetical protein
LLFVAAAARTEKAVYATVRSRWTLKCNDSIYSKILQLLTLAVYETRVLKEAVVAAAAAAAAAGGEGAVGEEEEEEEETRKERARCAVAATALETFVLEKMKLPLHDATLAELLNPAGQETVTMPSMLEAMQDVFYGSTASLDGNCMHWIAWLIEAMGGLSPACAACIAQYKAEHNIQAAAPSAASFSSSSSSSSASVSAAVDGVGGLASASSGTGAASALAASSATSASAAAPAATNSVAMTAKEKAMKAMQDKAAQFMAMMEGMSDSDEEDDEDEEGGGGGGDVKAAAAGASAGGSAVVAEKDSGIDGAAEAVGAAGSATAESTSKEADSSPVKTSTASSAENEADALPVCIVCQADANAEDTEGNARLMGYLSLVQASTVLAAHRTTNSAEAANSELIRLASGNIPSISSKIAPKKELSDRCSAHLSFCGHCT